jgi:hypothetical protein
LPASDEQEHGEAAPLGHGGCGILHAWELLPCGIFRRTIGALRENPQQTSAWYAVAGHSTPLANLTKLPSFLSFVVSTHFARNGFYFGHLLATA